MNGSELVFGLFNIGYLYILAIVIGAYLIGKVVAPILVFIGKKLTEKTETTLDDLILDAIKGPIESFFFLLLIELAIIFMPSYFELVDKAQIALFTDVAIMLFLFYLVYKAVHVFFKWYYEEGRKDSKVNVPVDLLPFFQKIIHIIIIISALVLCLGKFGIDVSALATLPLFIGLVAGLAAQEIVANMFYGLAMQMERNIKYGDYVKLPTGDVVKLKKIGLKTTKLLDLSGNEMLISNAEFAKMRVTKLAEPEKHAKVSVPFEIDYNISLDKLHESIKNKMEKSKDIMHEKGSITIVVSKFKQNWVEGNVTVMAVDLSHTTKINDIITRAIIEFTKKK